MRLVNYKPDDYRGVNCAEMSMRQTHSGYVYDEGGYGGNIKYVTVEFNRAFDVPPDIEQLSHVDDCCGRTFELTVHSVWMHRFTIKLDAQTKMEDGVTSWSYCGAQLRQRDIDAVSVDH